MIFSFTDLRTCHVDTHIHFLSSKSFGAQPEFEPTTFRLTVKVVNRSSHLALGQHGFYNFFYVST